MIFDKFFKSHKKEKNEQAYIAPVGSLLGFTFDGEQEPGAMSDGYLWDVDYYTMAQRAYTLVTTNEFAKILVTRLTEFVVGCGLRLHPQPMKNLLKRVFKINLDENFTKNIQDFWNVIEDDKNISSTKDKNIHALAEEIYYNGLIAGDVLVIKRVINGNLEYQIVNGLSVKSSLCFAQTNKENEKPNQIIDGVEVDRMGKPVAYYVLDKHGKEHRVEARDKKGRLIAWLVPVGRRKMNSPRTYSDLGAIMQKLHKIGQYTNSEVMAAEANSKFAVVVEQEKESSGINPIKNIPGIARSIQNEISRLPSTSSTTNNGDLDKLKNTFKHIASALAIFMPKGQKLSSFDTKRPNVNYTAFLDGSMKYCSSSFGIPFEVALMVFSNNFSASRASLKMFEVILERKRQRSLVDYFYQIVYEQMFELECLKGNIKAPKYLELKNDDGFLDNAYTKAKFVGLKIPHIDEVKEVNAVSSKLKSGLTTYEQALENLGITTDFDTLIERRKLEEDKIKSLGLNFETIFAPDNGSNNDPDTEEDKTFKK